MLAAAQLVLWLGGVRSDTGLSDVAAEVSTSMEKGGMLASWDSLAGLPMVEVLDRSVSSLKKGE